MKIPTTLPAAFACVSLMPSMAAEKPAGDFKPLFGNQTFQKILMQLVKICCAVLVGIFLLGCSDKRSSAKVAFEHAFAPKGILDVNSEPNLLSADDEVKAVFKGSAVSISPKKPYLLPYNSPTIYVTVRRLETGKAAAKEYESLVDSSFENVLKLGEHPDLPLGVPSIGYWNETPGDPKSLLFRYGNLIVVISDHRKETSPAAFQEIAKRYIGYLDSVPK